ncbi:MAG TPA: PQQ-binding-like beta-propeller repeat protein [Verrucomicrobiales bacterium]|nr:PQQ-binding-like beta-propeller repeat protein [Verrucomicrobiales bacterium]
MKKATGCIMSAVLAASVAGLWGEDWPQWGGSLDRNMISPAKDLPLDFDPGKFKAGSEEVDMSTTKLCKWVAKLGSQSYGTPTISGGKIFVGTNNENPRNSNRVGDRGVLMCFEEASGEFLWQLAVPKLGAGKVSDWEFLGICSSATVVGNRAYIVTNRCQIVCLDTEGLANGNDGPFTSEVEYMTERGEQPVELSPTDADVIWVFDMREELGVFPHNIASSSVAVVGDTVVATTSNGVDWSHTNIPSPQAPSLILLNAQTGELIGEEASGVSQRVLHCSWASPAFGKIGGRDTIVFGGGDGWCYGYNPIPEKDEEGFGILSEYWRYDCNPPEYRKDPAGNPVKYATYAGPSEVVATPVIHEDRVFVLVGQDPEHGVGVGMLSCIDATQSGDLSGKALWTYRDVHRSMSTPSVADGLVYVADYSGHVHCLDAKTGEPQWVFDTLGHIWASTLVVDGKVLIGNEEGELIVLEHGREKNELGRIEFSAPLYSSPVVANGTVYLATQTHLYAFGKN